MASIQSRCRPGRARRQVAAERPRRACGATATLRPGRATTPKIENKKVTADVSERSAVTGAPRKPAGALGGGGLWLFPARRAPPAEDATPESAAFGDQAPRAAAAWSDSRPDSARSSDAGPWRLPRPKPVHEAPVGQP